MLSRASSDAGMRLRRSKSTSTVHYPHTPAAIPELADPSIAYRHAVAAAATAYGRAYPPASSAAEPGLHRSGTQKSPKSEGRRLPKRGSSLGFGRHHGSVDNGIENRRTWRGRNSTLSHDWAIPTASQEQAATTSSIATPRANRRPHTDGSLNHSASLPAYNHRIRKAQSMFCTSTVQNQSLTEMDSHVAFSPFSVQNSLKQNTVPEVESPTIAAPADISSMSPKPLNNLDNNEDNTVAKSRDKVFQNFQLRKRASVYLGSFKKRQDKENSKASVTRMETRNVTYDSEIPMREAEIKTVVEVKLEKKRSISNSLKSKIKRVFRRVSNSSASSVLPAQQINASRHYFGGDQASERSLRVDDLSITRVHTPEGYALYRPRSTASLTSGYESPCPAPKSRESSSAFSDLESKSRVTSWTDSIGNMSSVRDMRRLSVIEEANRSGITFAPSNHPSSILIGDNLFQEPTQHAVGVDSRRVYSALMKKIDGLTTDNDPSLTIGGEADPLRRVLDTLPSHNRLGSFASGMSGITRSTIRAVTEEEQNGGPEINKAESIRGAVRIPRYPVTAKTETSHSPHNISESNGEEGQPKQKGLLLPRLRFSREKYVSPNPEQLAARAEKAATRWKAPLEEAGRGLFPVMVHRSTSGRSISGLGRRLTPIGGLEPVEEDAQSIKVPSPEADSQELTPVTKNVRPPSRAPPDVPEAEVQLTPQGADIYSPSVYSREVDYQSPEKSDEQPAASSGASESTGIAIVTESQPVKTYTLGSPERKSSARSSTDWKEWLSAQVVELSSPPRGSIKLSAPQSDAEKSSTSDKSRASHKKERNRGHRREHAEITGEETSLSSYGTSVLKFATVNSMRTGFTRQPSSGMNERFPMIDTGRRPSSQRRKARRRISGTPETESWTTTTGTLSQSQSTTSRTTKDSAENACIPVLAKENVPRRQHPSKPVQPLRANIERPHSLQPLGYSQRENSPNTPVTGSVPEPPLPAPDRILPTFASSVPSAPSASKEALNPYFKTSPYRPKSAVELRSKFLETQNKETAARLLQQLPRKPVTGRLLEGDSLRMVLEGPYGRPSPDHSDSDVHGRENNEGDVSFNDSASAGPIFDDGSLGVLPGLPPSPKVMPKEESQQPWLATSRAENRPLPPLVWNRTRQSSERPLTPLSVNKVRKPIHSSGADKENVEGQKGGGENRSLTSLAPKATERFSSEDAAAVRIGVHELQCQHARRGSRMSEEGSSPVFL